MNNDPVVLDLEEAIERMGDRETFLEIAGYFAGRIPEALDDIHKALACANAGEARRLAHSMKSNCGAMGAAGPRELCLALERACQQEDLQQAERLYAALAPRMRSLREQLLSLGNA